VRNVASLSVTRAWPYPRVPNPFNTGGVVRNYSGEPPGDFPVGPWFVRLIAMCDGESASQLPSAGRGFIEGAWVGASSRHAATATTSTTRAPRPTF
jgi:hypothetical protein